MCGTFDITRNTIVEILYILAKTVELFLSVISTCMFLRVIMQFFDVGGSRVFQFIVTVTEFFVFPFRVIMARLNIMQNTPIDAPFMVAYLFVIITSLVLPII